jgi:hypothetical protein
MPWGLGMALALALAGRANAASPSDATRSARASSALSPSQPLAAGALCSAADRAREQTDPPAEPWRRSSAKGGRDGSRQGGSTEQSDGDGKGGMRVPGRFMDHWRHLSEREIDEGMEFMKEHWPERHQLMEQLRASDPDAFRRAFQNIWPQLARIMQVYRGNPQLGEIEVELVTLEFKILRAARAYHHASRDTQSATTSTSGGAPLPPDLQAIREELTALVSQRFDLQVKRNELRIQELADQLSQQRERLALQVQNKQDEVARTVKRLISKRFLPKRIRSIEAATSPEDCSGKADAKPASDGPGGSRSPAVSTQRSRPERVRGAHPPQKVPTEGARP